MGFSDAVKIALENGNSIGVVAVVLIVVIAFLFALLTERIHVGKEFGRMKTRSDTLEGLVTTLTADLTASKILNAEARVRIEFLEDEVKDNRSEIAEIKKRLETVEKERDRIISTWQPPSNLRVQGQ